MRCAGGGCDVCEVYVCMGMGGWRRSTQESSGVGMSAYVWRRRKELKSLKKVKKRSEQRNKVQVDEGGED